MNQKDYVINEINLDDFDYDYEYNDQLTDHIKKLREKYKNYYKEQLKYYYGDESTKKEIFDIDLQLTKLEIEAVRNNLLQRILERMK